MKVEINTFVWYCIVLGVGRYISVMTTSVLDQLESLVARRQMLACCKLATKRRYNAGHDGREEKRTLNS